MNEVSIFTIVLNTQQLDPAVGQDRKVQLEWVHGPPSLKKRAPTSLTHLVGSTKQPSCSGCIASPNVNARRPGAVSCIVATLLAAVDEAR